MENRDLGKRESGQYITEQDRTKSPTFWVGMIDAAVVAVVGVLMAAGQIDEGVGGAIVAGSALYTDIATAIIRALKDSIK